MSGANSESSFVGRVKSFAYQHGDKCHKRSISMIKLMQPPG